MSQIPWLMVVGSIIASTSHKIMIYQPTSASAGNLIIYEWTSGAWSSLATLAVSDFGSQNITGLAAVSGTRVCAVGNGLVRMYDWDEATTISKPGNDGSFGGGTMDVSALSGSQVLFGAQSNPSWSGFGVLDYDGTDFASSGTDFDFGFGFTGSVYTGALTATTVAIVETSGDKLGHYTVSGGTWSLDGSELSIGASDPKGFESMTDTRVALAVPSISLNAEDWGGSSWSTTGNTYSAWTGTPYDICALAADTIAVIYRDTAGTAAVKISPPMTFDGSDFTPESGGSALTLADQTIAHAITCLSYFEPRA